MGGGRDIPMLMSTPATVGKGKTIANAKRIVPQSNFFILLPPSLCTARRFLSVPVVVSIPPVGQRSIRNQCKIGFCSVR